MWPFGKKEEPVKELTHDEMIDVAIQELADECDCDISDAVEFTENSIHDDCTKEEFKEYVVTVVDLQQKMKEPVKT